jgi:hypothetical protein
MPEQADLPDERWARSGHSVVVIQNVICDFGFFPSTVSKINSVFSKWRLQCGGDFGIVINLESSVAQPGA